jgi:hypothetical protein
VDYGDSLILRIVLTNLLRRFSSGLRHGGVWRHSSLPSWDQHLPMLHTSSRILSAPLVVSSLRHMFYLALDLEGQRGAA